MASDRWTVGRSSGRASPLLRAPPPLLYGTPAYLIFDPSKLSHTSSIYVAHTGTVLLLPALSPSPRSRESLAVRSRESLAVRGAAPPLGKVIVARRADGKFQFLLRHHRGQSQPLCSHHAGGTSGAPAAFSPKQIALNAQAQVAFDRIAQSTSVQLQAEGPAVSKAVTVAEIVKRRLRGVHQSTQIGVSGSVGDGRRLRPRISITLSLSQLDPKQPGCVCPAPHVTTHPRPPARTFVPNDYCRKFSRAVLSPDFSAN
jgi:DNA-binding protein